jgi:imidazolonepropionase-like amidohydrolase
MPKALLAVSASVVLALTACAGSSASVAEKPTDGARAIAFVGVNVLPMDRERVLENYTVLVNGGLIQTVAPRAEVQLPRDALVIDGAGKFLVPGFADLHTHLQTSGELVQYMANGVTTVLDLGSFVAARVLAFRDSTRSGAIAGPTVLASFFLDGSGGQPPGLNFFGARRVDDPAGARAAVQEAKNEGFDFLKVYNSLADSVFLAITDEARRQGLPVVGHGVRSMGLERSFAAGQIMLAHGEEYLYTFFEKDRDPSRIPEAVSFTRRSGAYVLPNLSTFHTIGLQWGRRAAVDSFLSRPEARLLDASRRQAWNGAPYLNRKGSLDERLAILYRLTRALSDSGVPLLLGTDSPQIPGMFAGVSIHDDLAHMVIAGLTPFQALSAGTRTAGEFLATARPGSEAFGIVASGQRADLILADGNPLDSLGTLRHPAGVMARGRWYPRERLAALVDSLARSAY